MASAGIPGREGGLTATHDEDGGEERPSGKGIRGRDDEKKRESVCVMVMDDENASRERRSKKVYTFNQ